MTTQAKSRASFATPESPLDVLQWMLALVLLFSLFRYLHDCARLWVESRFIDFAHYYTFATVVGKRLNPFDPEAVSGVEAALQIRRAIAPANYPPLFYILMLPWTFLPFRAAVAVWLLMGHTCLFASIHLCRRRLASTSPIPLIAVLFIVLNYQPIIEDLALGQANLLLLFLITLTWWCAQSGYLWGAAGALALLPFIKLQFGALILFLWWAGQSRIARRAILLVGLGLGLGLLLLGFRHHLDYLNYILALPDDFYTWTRNISVRATLAQFMAGSTPASNFTRYLTLVWNLALVLVLLRTIPRNARLESVAFDYSFSLGVTSVLLLSPLVEEHHLVVLLLPISLLLLRMPEESMPCVEMVLLLGSILLLGSRYSLERFPMFHQGPLSLLSKGKLLGVAGLACALLLRLRRDTRRTDSASSVFSRAGTAKIDAVQRLTSAQRRMDSGQ